MHDLLAYRIKSILSEFKTQHVSFFMVCCYIFIEYVRPQSIMPALDILPWAQTFLLLSAITLFLDKDIRLVKHPLNKWMIAFFLVIIASTIFAYNRQISIDRLADFYTWFIIYFLIIHIVNNEKRLFIFLLIIILASAKLSYFGAKTWALRGFSFTSWGIMGPPGYFQNSGELAIQMLVLFGISYFLFQAQKEHLKGIKYWFLLLCPITAAMTIMGASSRGSQIALVILLLIIFWNKISIKRTIAISLLVFAGYSLMPDEQISRFTTVGNDNTSVQRLLYWENGVKMIQEHPTLGVGFFNFPSYYADVYPNDLIGMRTKRGAELPHNIFIQVGSELGVLGLITYCLLIIGCFRSNRKVRAILKSNKKENSWLSFLSQGLNLGFLGFLVAGQFVSVVYYPFMWITIALSVCLRNIVINPANK
ncbi:MAG TPA: hypothetical protein ENJ08_14790 [Gammaproteobacteria bacterium]|nr:hypothetical protein [Gammaproteobacteria bacterium]